LANGQNCNVNHDCCSDNCNDEPWDQGNSYGDDPNIPRYCQPEGEGGFGRRLSHSDPAYDANNDGWTDTCYNSCVSWCDSACGADVSYTYSLPRTMPATCQSINAFFPGPSCGDLQRSCSRTSAGAIASGNPHYDCKRTGFDDWAGTGCTGCAGGGCLANSGIGWSDFECNLVGECIDDSCRRRRLSEEAANASNTSSSSYAESDCCSCKPLAEQMKAKREERQRRERRRVEDES